MAVSWARGYRRPDDRLAAPHRLLRERPAFVVQDVAANMRARVEQELRETGLSWVDFALLLVAVHVGGLPQQALASRAGIDRSRTSAALTNLEYEGLVERSQCVEDARRTLVAATEAGGGILAEALEAVDRGERKALHGLSARERARLHSLLDRLVQDDTPPFFRRW
jgi:DNA-binding MarR family transcriptional regulator